MSIICKPNQAHAFQIANCDKINYRLIRAFPVADGYFSKTLRHGDHRVIRRDRLEISLCPPCLCVQNIVESSSWPQAAVLFSCSAHVHENVAYLASLQLIFQKKISFLRYANAHTQACTHKCEAGCPTRIENRFPN